MQELEPLEPTWIGVDLASGSDYQRWLQAEIVKAFGLPPRVIYRAAGPYLVVDNKTKPD